MKKDFILSRCDTAENILSDAEPEEFLQAELKDCIRLFREASSGKNLDQYQRQELRKSVTSVFMLIATESWRRMAPYPKLAQGFLNLSGAASEIEDFYFRRGNPCHVARQESQSAPFEYRPD